MRVGISGYTDRAGVSGYTIGRLGLPRRPIVLLSRDYVPSSRERELYFAAALVGRFAPGLRPKPSFFAIARRISL